MTHTVSLYTIGHSSHATESFIALLRRHRIDLLIDVRSQPYSQWTHQFNREVLRQDLIEAGIGYRFMGDRLGGRPNDPHMYDPGEERPNYRRMAESSSHQQAIDDLIAIAAQETVAVMCSEGDHAKCHRHLLITQTLLKRGCRVRHIQPDGTLVEGTAEPEQLSLFGFG
ncbi:MAG: DUF488 family protein [Anaerolineae bacterium]